MASVDAQDVDVGVRVLMRALHDHLMAVSTMSSVCEFSKPADGSLCCMVGLGAMKSGRGSAGGGATVLLRRPRSWKLLCARSAGDGGERRLMKCQLVVCESVRWHIDSPAAHNSVVSSSAMALHASGETLAVVAAAPSAQRCC